MKYIALSNADPKNFVQFWLSFLSLACPFLLLTWPQHAIAQPEKDVYIEKFVVQAMTKSFLGYHEEAISIYKKALNMAPTSAVVNSAIAEEYEKLEDYDSAAVFAIQARDYAPENPYYHLELADLYIKADKIPAAERSFEEMIARFPDNLDALQELAYLQYANGLYDKALVSYQKLLEKTGPQPKISYRLLQIHYKRGDPDGMEQALMDLEKQNPANPSIKRNLAELYIQFERIDEAIATLESALALDSLNTEIIVPLAKLYEERGRTRYADSLWDRAMQTSGSPEDAFLRASHLYSRANEHPETLDVVIRLLEYALARDPSYTEALVLLGTIKFEERDFERAGDLLYRATQVNPRNPDVWLQAAAAYLRIERPERAADIADEALLLFPGQTSLLRVAAYGFMEAYRNDDSIERFEEFYGLLKNDPAQTRELSEIQAALGLLYARKKDYPASDQAYLEALRLSPDNTVVLNNLAYSLAERNHALEEALDYANRAVELESGNPSFLDTLGWVHFKMGAYKTAERWITRAIEAGASSASTFEHLGDIQLQLGKIDEAVASWNRSLEIKPDNAIVLQKVRQNQ